MTDLVTLFRVKAVQSDGERWIEGYATTNQEDRQGDVVEPRGAKYSLPIPLLFQHKHDQPIGAITQATVSDKGIRIRARLSVGVAKAEEVWTLVKDGVLTAVSIGFRVLDQKPHGNYGARITSWEWLECSVVSVPANPGALISVAKCMAMDVKYLDSGRDMVTSTKPADPAWMTGISTRGGIDGAKIFDASAANAKNWLTEKFAESPKKFPQLAGLYAKLAHAMACSTLGRVIDLERRLSVVEGSKNLDAEVFDEVAKCIERLELMQAELGERTVRFRGYWRDGMDAGRGDMFSDRGSTWIAVRSTRDRPESRSPDWCIAARGAKDV